MPEVPAWDLVALPDGGMWHQTSRRPAGREQVAGAGEARHVAGDNVIPEPAPTNWVLKLLSPLRRSARRAGRAERATIADRAPSYARPRPVERAAGCAAVREPAASSAGASPSMIGCYTGGASGQLMVDDAAGTAVVETDGGHRYAVTWPLGYTWRSSWGVGDGGCWTDCSFLACWEVH